MSMERNTRSAMTLKNYKIILGSSSPARKEVLQKLGYTFEIMASDIDERAIRDSDPKKLTSKLANAKALALLKKINFPALLITADQVVNYNGVIREKPETPQEARDFLKSYEQFPAETINTVVVTDTTTGQKIEASDSAKIYFKKIPDHTIEQLIDQGNVFRQAGGFSIWDPLVKPYIQKIEGEEESIMGLPAKIIKELLEQFNT